MTLPVMSFSIRNFHIMTLSITIPSVKSFSIRTLHIITLALRHLV